MVFRQFYLIYILYLLVGETLTMAIETEREMIPLLFS